MIEVAQNRFSIQFEEKNHKFKDKPSQLCYLCSKLIATYVFVGSCGRKGEQ